MNETTAYSPPKVWAWSKESGGRFAAINRPVAGATHATELGVEPQQVVLGEAEATDGCLRLYSGVRAMPVVTV
jgi:hypothetical protein